MPFTKRAGVAHFITLGSNWKEFVKKENHEQ